MRKLVHYFFTLAWASSLALAQSSPNLQTGQIPTAAQWNSYFAAKTDYAPGGLPVARGGTGATDAATARLNLGISSPADLATALPSGSTSTLYGGTGGAGVARVITLGTGLSMAGSTLNSTASGTGTVTNVSGVNTNGFSFSVANGTTTPAITLSTSTTGVLKGSAGALATATNADLPAMSSTVGGAVPTPPNNTTQFLRGDGAWATPAGSGIGTVTSFSFNNNNGFVGLVTSPTSTPALTISTNLSGVLKGTGAGMTTAINSDLPAMTATVGGAVPTPPNDITKFLRGDGTWAVTGGGGGSGTVTSVSVQTANGFGGIVVNASTTPAIAISTPVVGVLKGNGTSMVAATSGTDFSAGTGGLTTGILKSTTGSGALSIAIGNDLPEMSATVRGAVPTPPNDVSKFLAGNGTWQTVSGGIAGLSASGQALTYEKTVSGNAAVFLGVISGTTLTVSSFSGGRPLIVGDIVTGAGVNNGQRIVAFGTGSGGNGTYTINQSQSIGSEAMAVPNYDQVSLIVQNDNPGFSSPVNGTTGSTGSPLNFSQININGSYVYPAAESNNGFGGFLNFITRNIAGSGIQGAFVNGGLIGTAVGTERGDLDFGIYGPPAGGVGINVPRVIALRAESTGRLALSVDADNWWDIGDTTTRWRDGFFRGTVNAGNLVISPATGGAAGNPWVLHTHSGSIQNISSNSLYQSNNGSFTGAQLAGTGSLIGSATMFNRWLDTDVTIGSEFLVENLRVGTGTGAAFENTAGRFVGSVSGNTAGAAFPNISIGVMGSAYSTTTNGSHQNVGGFFDIWDSSSGGSPLNIGVSIEMPQTSAGSTNIGINLQPNATVTGVIGIQMQSIGSAVTYASFLAGGAAKAVIGFDFRGATFTVAPLALSSGALNFSAHTVVYGWIPVAIDSGGAIKYIPLYN